MICEYLEVNLYPEFDDYQLMQDYNKDGETFNPNASLFDKLAFSFKKAFGAVKNKLNDVDWKENAELVKEAGNKAYKVTKKAGNYIYEKSLPLIENISDKTKNIYNDIVKPEQRIDLTIEDNDDFRKKSMISINESFMNEPFLDELEKLKK